MIRRKCHQNHKSSFVLLLWLSLVSTYTGKGFLFSTNNDNCDVNQNSKYQSLYCWLSEYKIHLPDVSFKEMLFTMSLTDIVCHNMKISSIESSLKSNTTMQLTFPQSMEISCDGNYQIGFMGGQVSVLVQHGFDMEAQFLPEFQVPTCNAQQIAATSVDFTGSISAHIIEWFHSSIENHITSTLHHKFCDSLQHEFPSFVQSQLIKPIQTYINELIHNATTTPDNHHNKNIVHDSVTWKQDLSGLKILLNSFQKSIVNPFLNKGFLLHLFPGLSKYNGNCGYFYNGFQGDWFPQLLLDAFHPDVNSSDVPFNIMLENITTLTNLTLLQPSSPSALNVASIKYPEGMNVFIQVNDDNDSIHPFSLTLSMSHVELIKSLLSFASINRTVFSSMGITDILSQYHNLQFTEIDVNVSLASITIHTPQATEPIGTSLEQDVDQIFMTLLNRILLPNYSALITKVIWAYIQATVRKKLNQILFQPSMEETTNYNDDAIPDNVLLFSVYKTIKSFNESFQQSLECRWHLLERYLSDDLSKPRKIIGPWNLKSVQFLQYPSLDSFELFEPIDGSHIENSLKIAHEKESIMMFKIDNYKDTEKSIHLYFAVSDIDLFLGNGFDYNMKILQSIQLQKILANPLQLVVPLQNAGIYGLARNNPGNFTFHVEVDDFNNNTHNTQQSFAQSIQRDLVDGFTAVQTVKHDLDALLSPSINIFQKLMNVYLEMNLYQNFLSDTTYYNKTQSTNADHDEYDNYMLYLNGIILLSVYAVVNIIFLSIQLCKKRNEDEPPEEILLPQPTDQEQQNTKFPKNLMFSRRTPPFVRYLIPALISCTIFLFVISAGAKGAELGLGFTIPFIGTVGPISLFEFTLIHTLGMMWENKVYLLFFVILIFSLIWPYVKLILMFFAWTVPEWLFSLEQREELLFWLDALGKFSLVDIFAMVVFMTVFKFHLEIMGLSVATYIEPKFGFHFFLYATVASLFIGHAATYLHRKSVRPTTSGSSNHKCSIRTHLFYGDAEGSYKKLSMPFQVVLVGCLIVDIVLLALGMFRSFYVFEIGGIPGVILGFPANRKEVSVWSFGLLITDAVVHPDFIGVRMVQAIYMFFAVVMPFVSLVVNTVLFLAPMSIKAQERMHALAEVSNAWSSIEVFLLASLMCTLQLPKFIAALRKKNCTILEEIFKEFYFKEMFGTDKCLDIHTHMKLEAIVLYIAVGIHIFLMYIFLKLSHRVVHDRIERENSKSMHTSTETMKETTKHDSKRFFQRFLHGRVENLLFVAFIPPEQSTEHLSLINDPEEN